MTPFCPRFLQRLKRGSPCSLQTRLVQAPVGLDVVPEGILGNTHAHLFPPRISEKRRHFAEIVFTTKRCIRV